MIAKDVAHGVLVPKMTGIELRIRDVAASVARGEQAQAAFDVLFEDAAARARTRGRDGGGEAARPAPYDDDVHERSAALRGGERRARRAV